MVIVKPWNGIAVPEVIYSPKGMIGPEERRALFWIGAKYYKGDGAIVDAGAYVGASALCMAAGLTSNPLVQDLLPMRIIRSYDYFKAIDDYVVAHISRDFRRIKAGEDYLEIFRAQTRSHSDLIWPVPGDFLEARWSDGPIEVLFIDIAKTPQLNSHLLREFFPHLIPGRSLIMQQDYYHCWHPHIHITMEALAPYFEVLDGFIEHQSRLYLYSKPIPPAVLTEVADYRYTPPERIALLDALATREAGNSQAMIYAVKLWQLVQDGDHGGVERAYSEFLRNYAKTPNKHLWWTQAQEIINHYTHELARRADGT